jgi:uncharacterized membrane protein YphA (DoxX/SURF4 family)
MRFAFALILIVHGVAHLLGFIVPWKLVKLEDSPYTTTLLGGRLDVGDAGIRFSGVLWLLAGIGFVVSGAALMLLAPWWPRFTIVVAAFSLVLAVAGWPGSRIGIPIDLLLLVYLLVGASFGWLSALGI